LGKGRDEGRVGREGWGGRKWGREGRELERRTEKGGKEEGKEGDREGGEGKIG
jgi:hypothetical protein